MTVTSYFPDKPVVELSDNALLSFSCIKDEATRLPYFLDFYSSQGVEHFFFVLNNTTDSSFEILSQRDDVTVFHSAHSYKGSGAGRDMLYELCDHYAKGHWTLTLDVDEILVVPGSPYLTLQEFIVFLDDEGAEGFYTVFLDFYSDKPLSETVYLPGDDPFEVCQYYETSTYALGLSANPPHFKISGGPRWRIFWHGDEKTPGPAMRKVPLVRWTEGFRYLYSTHSHAPIKLSSTTGVLAHFKFISEFESRTASDNAGSDRRQAADYQRYAVGLESDPCFKTPFSRRYRSSADLCRDGVICVSKLYREFIRPVLSRQGVPEGVALPKANAALEGREGELSISAVSAVWPFFTARQTVTESIPSQLASYNTAERLRDTAASIEIECVLEDSSLLWMGERAQMAMATGSLQIEVLASSGVVVWHGLLDSLIRFPDTNIPNLYLLPVGHADVGDRLEVLLVPEDVRSRAVVGSMNVATLERLDEGSVGCIEAIDEGGLVTGWCLNSDSLSWRESVCFWVGETYVGKTIPSVRRRDLDERSPRAFGFEYALPPLVRPRIHTETVWCSVAANGHVFARFESGDSTPEGVPQL